MSTTTKGQISRGRGQGRRLVAVLCSFTIGATALVGSAPGSAAAEPADTHRAITYREVFSRDQDGYNSFRIPSIVQTESGTVLAFAEGRVNSPSDNGNIDVVLKRSSDGGDTWGPLQVIDDNGDGKSGNPVPIVDRETGAIVLVNTRTGPDETLDTIRCGIASAENTRRPFLQTSTDDGLTWSAPRDITAQAKLSDWRHFVGGPGHGIQLEHGPHAGRLLFAGNHSIVPPAGVDCSDPSVFGGHAIYSDDHGETWQVGGVDDSSPVNPNEGTLAELPDGTVYFNSRSGGEVATGRVATTSSDGGSSFDHEFELVTDVTTTHVAGSAVVKDDQGRTRVLLSAPSHPTGRERMSLWSSLDRGASWKEGPMIYFGPSAYSDLVQLDSKSRPIGMLYENGDRTPVDSRLTWSQRITFARFPVGLLNASPPHLALTPDSGPGAHHGEISGEPQQVGARFGNGFELSGDYVEVPRTDALLFGTAPFTAAAWFRTSSTRRQTIVFAYGTGNSPQWSIRLLANRTLRAEIRDGTSTAQVDSTAADFADGQWHQVVLSRDDSGSYLYVDGQLAATGPALDGSVSENSRAGIRFGARLDGINDPLLGGLDEAWLFDRALTGDQVRQLYTDNTPPAEGTALHLELEETSVDR